MEWAWGDFDNDGDMDVFISGDTNEGLYENGGSTPLSPSTHTARSSGGCTSPTNAFASDNARTDCDGDPAATDVSDYHNFGFAIPAGATITGIRVGLEHRHNNCVQDVGLWNMTLRNDLGNLVGTSQLEADTICHDTDRGEYYGGRTDLWGTTWTPAQINDIDFGVALNYTATGGGGQNDGLADHVNMTVYYTPGPPAGEFVDVTSLSGITITNPTGADWGDYDNDGDLDLVIANGASTILYTNNGAGNYDFHETPLNGLLDINNVVGWIDYDGDLDIMGGEGELYRNNLYDHTDLPNNPNMYLRVLPVGNATNAAPDHGSPLTPIGAQIQIKNSADMSLVASSEIFAGYNNFQPPNYRHFGGIDRDSQLEL